MTFDVINLSGKDAGGVAVELSVRGTDRNGNVVSVTAEKPLAVLKNKENVRYTVNCPVTAPSLSVAFMIGFIHHIKSVAVT